MRKNLLAIALMFGVGLGTVGFIWLFLLSLDHRRSPRKPTTQTSKDNEPPPDKEKKSPLREGEFLLRVDYDQSLVEATKGRKFDRLDNPFALENFPRHKHENGKAEIVAKFMSPTKNMEVGEILAGIDKMGYRSATLRELLAFANDTPAPYSSQDARVLVLDFFGRDGDGFWRVPYYFATVNEEKKRSFSSLDLRHRILVCPPSDKFLVVRKDAQAPQ